MPTKIEKGRDKSGKDDKYIAETLAAVPIACRKALRWLQSMAMTDHAWKSGFEMCNELYSRIESAKHFKAREVSCSVPSLLTRSGAPHDPVLLPPPPLAEAHGPLQSDLPSTMTSQSYPNTDQLLCTRELPSLGPVYGRDATPDFQSDIGQPPIEAPLNHNPTLDSDAAWLLSVVESEA